MPTTLTKQNEQPIATITFKYKTAQRKFLDRVVWDRLRQNSPVYNGDTIHTAALSEATIWFNDGNVMDLMENTMAQVFLTADNQAAVELEDGYATVDSSDSDNGFTLSSNGVQVAVKAGTSLSAGSVSQEATTTATGTDKKAAKGLSVQVLKGTASVQNADGTSTAIAQGQELNMSTTEGGATVVPSRPTLTVLSPARNEKILYHTQGAANVHFTRSLRKSVHAVRERIFRLARLAEGTAHQERMRRAMRHAGNQRFRPGFAQVRHEREKRQPQVAAEVAPASEIQHRSERIFQLSISFLPRIRNHKFRLRLVHRGVGAVAPAGCPPIRERYLRECTCAFHQQWLVIQHMNSLSIIKPSVLHELLHSTLSVSGRRLRPKPRVRLEIGRNHVFVRTVSCCCTVQEPVEIVPPPFTVGHVRIIVHCQCVRDGAKMFVQVPVAQQTAATRNLVFDHLLEHDRELFERPCLPLRMAWRPPGTLSIFAAVLEFV